MATVINTKIGETRGVMRVWFEGRKLAREGFTQGVKYQRTIIKGKITMVRHENGNYVVSGRKRRNCDDLIPIIDVANQELTDSMDGVTKVKIVIRRGIIVITPHAAELKKREREGRLMQKIKQGDPLSVTSLFHGGGVLDKAAHHGLERAGVASYVGMVVEIEDKYLESSLSNNPELWADDSIIVHSPIEDATIRPDAYHSDIMIAALPCTGASKSGRSKNKLKHAEDHQAAGGMFYYFLRYVESVNPAIIQIENVKEYQSTAAMAAIRNVLECMGYAIQEHVFMGTEYGALEARERLCVVAVSNGLDLNFDLSQIAASQTKAATIGDILEPVANDDPRWKEYEYLAEKERRDIKAGKGFKRQLLTPDAEQCGTIGRGYSKARSTEPFLIHPENPDLSRLFTAKEHARIKTIPESIVADQSETTAQEILGQSVIFMVFVDIYAELGFAMRAANTKTKALNKAA